MQVRNHCCKSCRKIQDISGYSEEKKEWIKNDPRGL